MVNAREVNYMTQIPAYMRSYQILMFPPAILILVPHFLSSSLSSPSTLLVCRFPRSHCQYSMRIFSLLPSAAISLSSIWLVAWFFSGPHRGKTIYRNIPFLTITFQLATLIYIKTLINLGFSLLNWFCCQPKDFCFQFSQMFYLTKGTRTTASNYSICTFKWVQTRWIRSTIYIKPMRRSAHLSLGYIGMIGTTDLMNKHI